MPDLLSKGCVRSVLERDIDLLMLEELHVSEAFRRWFIGQVKTESDYSAFSGAWHSLTAAILGESDIVMVYASTGNIQQAIMIENKITEKAQSNQSSRYRERGEEGIGHGWWDHFITCIIAPQKYLSGMAKLEEYDVYLPYEAIEGYFLSQGGDRNKYRATMLREAIEQNRRGYEPVVSNKNTDFWQAYYDYSRKYFPELNMRLPENKGKKSTWVYFHPAKKQKNMRLQHKTERGCVDLEFTGMARKIDDIISIKQKYERKTDDDMSFHTATSSVVIRINVETVSYASPFDAQQKQIKGALEAINRLANLL